MARRSLILIALLCAFTGYGQAIRVGSLTVTGGANVNGGATTTVLRATSHATFAGGTTNIGPTATLQSAPLVISGAFALAPTTNTALTVNQSTNAYQLYVTNANFTVTFTGTPLNGTRGQFDVVNTGATNIVVTWPISWSVSGGAAVTSITAASNSITEVFWYSVGSSNRVRVASKEIVENFLNPTAGQVVSFHDANTKTNTTVAGTGDVTAASSFGTDNRIIRSDGTGKGVQSSAIAIDDTGITSFGQGATAQGEIRLLEDTDNGANYVALTPAASLAGNTIVTVPAVTGLMALHNNITNIYEFSFGETNVLATGTTVITWRAPHAMTIVDLRASLGTVSSSGIPTVDINEGGTTIISTKLTIDASEKTSTTAAAAYVLSDAAIADDAEITFDIDVAGTGAAGLKVKIYYTR